MLEWVWPHIRRAEFKLFHRTCFIMLGGASVSFPWLLPHYITQNAFGYQQLQSLPARGGVKNHQPENKLYLYGNLKLVVKH